MAEYDTDEGLNGLTGLNGYTYEGQRGNDVLGGGVALLPDFNGGGFADVVVSYRGSNFIGHKGVLLFNGGLASANNTPDAHFLADSQGATALGSSLASIGDFNNDGYSDFIVGEPLQRISFGDESDIQNFDTDLVYGQAYVVLGKAGGYGGTVNMDELANGPDAFEIVGWLRSGRLGSSVAGAGDLNNDGYDDIIVGAPRAGNDGTPDFPEGRRSGGEAYVIYGQADAYDDNIDTGNAFVGQGLRAYDDSTPQTLRFQSTDSADELGTAVAGAGDFNGDGFDDVIMGAIYAQGVNDSANGFGEVYVYFGSAGRTVGTIVAGDLNGENGFIIEGDANSGRIGAAVSGVGDLNNDGFDDIAFGGRDGQAYVMLGRADGFEARIKASEFEAGEGFRYSSGAFSISAAGDLNDDGYDDFLTGRTFVGDGQVSITYGDADGRGFTRTIQSFGDDALTGWSVAGGADVNGDGTQDIAIGSLGAAGAAGPSTGALHVLYATPDVPRIVQGTDGNDTLIGRAGSDSMFGLAGSDTLLASAGDDYLDGGTGADLLNGGPGSDTYAVDHAGDQIVESRKWAGTDTVFSSVDFRMGTKHIEILALTGDARLGAGNGLTNVIYGNDGDNVLDGGKNVDTLVGGFGNDTYLLRAPGDNAVEFAGQGIDTVKAFRSIALDANVENLFIQTLRNAAGEGVPGVNGIGNDLGNTIVGNPFDNFITGRGGIDTLKGQAGADTFVFDRALGATNVDRIIDFNTNEASEGDRLFLKQSVFTGMTKGDLAASAFAAGTAAADADDRIIFDRASGQLWFDADGTGAQGQQLIATFEQNALLTAADIEVF